MKKAMFFVVSLLFSGMLFAAPLTLTQISGTGEVGISSGAVVFASGGPYSGGETVNDHYQLQSTSDTAGFFSLTFNPMAADTSVDIVNNSQTFSPDFTLVPFQGGAIGVATYVTLLTAGSVYDIYINFSDAIRGSNYDLRIDTPIPAALWLFAPALMGFFGLRRRARAVPVLS